MAKKSVSEAPSRDTPRQTGKLIGGSPPNQGKAIIRSLRKIMQLLDVHSRRLLKQFGLTIPQVMCLYEVFEKGALPVTVLADSIHMAPSTLIGIVDRLAQKGLVKRTRNTDDRRSVFVMITGNGHRFVTETPYLLHNRLHDDLNNLAPDRQLGIADALNSIVGLLEDK